MIDEAQLLALMNDLESDRVERTVGITDTKKFRQAICAFSNDYPDHRQPGFLLLGVDDKSGARTGLEATDDLLLRLGGLRQDGEILPPPAMQVYKITLSDGTGDVVIVEVEPSILPPVRFSGRVWIRVGPRKAVANETEERILSERRIASAKTFDLRPCVEASIDDMQLDVFLATYRGAAVAQDVIESNNRTVQEQLAALRFYDLNFDRPTNAGILLFGRNPKFYFPGAYVQYLHIDGDKVSDPVKIARSYEGPLPTLVRSIDSLLDGILESRPVRVSRLRDEEVNDYPPTAIRELLLNALCHRCFDSNNPVRFYRFKDHLEISNPGGLYGEVSPENFPNRTDYRNPILAESLKVLGFVNRFGRGVLESQRALLENGNGVAEFDFDPASLTVRIPISPHFLEKT